MFQNWEFLLGEIWGLIALAALVGLFAGWLIWNRSRELRTLRSDLKSRTRELEKVQKNNATLTSKYDGTVAAHESERNALRAASDKMEADLADHVKRNAALENSLSEWKSREQSLAKKMEDRDVLIRAKSKAESEHANEIARMRRRDEMIAKMKSDLQMAKSQAERATALEAELEASRAQIHQARQDTNELERLREKSERVDQLERNLTRASAEAAGLTSLKAQLEARNDKIRELEQSGRPDQATADRIVGLERDLQAAKASGGAVNALRSEVDRLRGAVATRDATIASLRPRSAEATPRTLPSSLVSASSGDAGIPDYDGDGRLEGRNEGRKPDTLQTARGGRADDLKRIKGVGPALERMLNRMGFFHYDQVAAWTSEEVAWVDANLDGFNGRVTRDEWVAQAQILASGGSTEFASRVDDGAVYSA